MNIGIIIFIICALVIFNIYSDGRYLRNIFTYKKYYKMAMCAFVGLSLYVFIKQRPQNTYSLLESATKLAHFIPMDRYSSQLINPIIDFTSRGGQFPELFSGINAMKYSQANSQYEGFYSQPPNINMNSNIATGIMNATTFGMAPQMKRMLNSSGRKGKDGKIKRSVSDQKKKYVASQQGWKCGHCGQVLDATYEVDHKQALYLGGDNSISNLEALCRNCHGIKTLKDRVMNEKTDL